MKTKVKLKTILSDNLIVDEEQIKDLEIIDKNLQLSKLQLSKFKFEKVSARDSVECDDCQTTSDILEDEEIIEIVN